MAQWNKNVLFGDHTIKTYDGQIVRWQDVERTGFSNNTYRRDISELPEVSFNRASKPNLERYKKTNYEEAQRLRKDKSFMELVHKEERLEYDEDRKIHNLRMDALREKHDGSSFQLTATLKLHLEDGCGITLDYQTFDWWDEKDLAWLAENRGYQAAADAQTSMEGTDQIIQSLCSKLQNRFEDYLNQQAGRWVDK